jgi:hypothetical protein
VVIELQLLWWCARGAAGVLQCTPPSRCRQEGVADATPASPTSSDAL